MSRHTAPDELLLDYAAGALPEGPALVVALQCALDPATRRAVDRLRDIGGALLDQEEVAAFEESALEQVLARLDGVAVEPPPVPRIPPAGFEWAPAPLVPYLGRAPRWRKALGGFERVSIGRLANDTHRLELLRLQPGQGLPLHRHVGNEYTVVLQGGFTDNTGNYGVGDFAMGPGSQDHEPIADPGEPCIALIVLEQPIVLSGPWARWLNPLVKRGWL
jgi:putative transcriptional regulator